MAVIGNEQGMGLVSLHHGPGRPAPVSGVVHVVTVALTRANWKVRSIGDGFRLLVGPSDHPWSRSERL